MDLHRCAHTRGEENNSLNCSKCGVYIFRYQLVFGIKSRRFVQSPPSCPRIYLSFLKSFSKVFCQLAEVHLLNDTRVLLDRLVGKFKLGDDTIALGLYLYYSLFMNSATDSALEGKFATSCLYEAAKIKESGKRIDPERFRKYSNGTFCPQEFCELENEILTKLDYNLQLPTFLDFLYFYLSNGCVFSNEAYSIQPNVVEDKAVALSRWFLATGVFMLIPPQQLACYVLYRSRRESKVVEVWNWYIEEYTGRSVQEMNKYVRDIDKLICSFGPVASALPK